MKTISVSERFSVLIILQFSIGSIFGQENEKRFPPKISSGKWKSVDYFQERSGHNFTCLAEGTDLNYQLFKDSVIFSSNKNGHFFLEDAGLGIDGIYHCRVQSKYGTSITDKTNLMKAVTVEFPKVEDNVKIKKLSDSCHITCKPRNTVVPDPVITWYRKTNNSKVEKVEFSNEIQFDGKDTLYFANAENHMLYEFWCSASNNFLRTSGNSTFFHIETASSTKDNVVPTLLTSSSSPASSDKKVIVGFINGSITMRCLFAGYPTPDVTWLKNGGSPISDQWHFSFNSTEISSNRPLDASYKGTYTCAGKNAFGNARYDMELEIRASPSFLSDDDRPKDAIIPNGANATFRCSPVADPPANISWLRNGVLLDAGNLPRNYFLNPNGTQLSITNVCNNCQENDFCVIRCEVANAHGHNSSEGYLAVIDKTMLDENYYKDILWKPHENLMFLCIFTYDKGFPSNCTWYHEEKLIAPGEDNRVMVDENGTLTLITENDEDGGKTRLGTYKVVVSNDYSSDEKSFKVFEAKSEKISSINLWWISLIVLAILLLLILLIILMWCCCCMKKNRNNYPVDKKERLMGNDPIKELGNQSFQDYQAQSGNISYTDASGKLGVHDGRPFPITYYANEVVDYGVDDALSIRRYDDNVSLRSNRQPYSTDVIEGPQAVLRRDSSVHQGGNYSSAPAVYNLEATGAGNFAGLNSPYSEAGDYAHRPNTSFKRHTYESHYTHNYNHGPQSEV